MKITPQEYETLLDELADIYHLPDYDPKIEVTAAELARHDKITFHTAKNRLESMEFEWRYVRMPTGKKAKAYRKK